MEKTAKKNIGLKRLVARCRSEFRRPENTEYYSEEDYREAEKKYVRFCLNGGPLNTGAVAGASDDR